VKSFTVVWLQTAVDQLAQIWLDGTDRDLVVDAVEAIDSLLSNDPSAVQTTDLAEGLRALTVVPLRVIYAVREADCIVEVATVRRVVVSLP